MKHNHQKQSVLIIDDTPEHIHFGMAVLKDRAKIQAATSGLKALSLMRSHPPDLVLLDILMPGMNGFQVLEAIREDSELKDIPVLMLTAQSDTEDVVKALDMGANDYLKKPFDPAELIARVSSLLRLKAAEDRLKASVSRMAHHAALGVQAAGFVHDLKNILALVGNHELITLGIDSIEAKLSPSQVDGLVQPIEIVKEACDQIAEALEFGDSLCRSIVAFSKSASAVKNNQPLVPLVTVLLEMHKRQFRNNKIRVTTEFDEIAPVYCNGGEIQRVLLNLITNALFVLKKSPLKELTLKIWQENRSARLSITDTGGGIAKDILPHIFKSHFTTKAKDQGSGIGLDTAFKIVTEHNGKIEVETEVGKYTTFILTLPAAECSSMNR
jgi:DNA-binding response OmpR family regulator